MEPLKHCRRCDEDKPISEFNLDPSRKDGRHPYCTPCKTKPYRNPDYWPAYRAEVQARTEKRCSNCTDTKPIDEFHKRADALDGRNSWCKACVSTEGAFTYNHDKARAYYERIRASRLSAGQKRRELRKFAVLNRLGGKCIDCGLQPGDDWPIACFDFHHLDPSIKVADIGSLLHLADKEKADEELKKCIVLCANCHRRRHSIVGGSVAHKN